MSAQLEVSALTDGRQCLRPRVSPGARKARIAGCHAGALKLAVTEPPERGKANGGAIALVARAPGLPARDLEIVAGHAWRDKRMAVAGFAGDAKELKRRIEGLAPFPRGGMREKGA